MIHLNHSAQTLNCVIYTFLNIIMININIRIIHSFLVSERVVDEEFIPVYSWGIRQEYILNETPIISITHIK